MRPCNRGKTRIARREPLCGQRQCGKEQKGISKMQAQKESVYCGSFQTANVIEQNQKGTKESLIEQKQSCGDSRVARPIAFCGATPAPKQKDSCEDERQSARYSVREFDYCLDLRSRWENHAVAEWPMAAASCSGSGCADVSAPNGYCDVIHNEEPRKIRKRDSAPRQQSCSRCIHFLSSASNANSIGR